MTNEYILQELRSALCKMDDDKFNAIMDSFERMYESTKGNHFIVVDESSRAFGENYDSLKDGEQFVWRNSFGDLLAVKLPNHKVIVFNKDNKFVVGTAYSNCISLGDSLVAEYDSFSEALQSVKGTEKLTAAM